jgi:hypothetical protein
MGANECLEELNVVLCELCGLEHSGQEAMTGMCPIEGHNIKEITFPGSPALQGVELHTSFDPARFLVKDEVYGEEELRFCKGFCDVVIGPYAVSLEHVFIFILCG